MSLRDDYDFSIIENTIKERVIDTLEDEFNLRGDSVCKCEECVIDIVCFSLNRIKPNYSASLYGSLYSRADAENKSEEIERVVTEAVDFVSSNASHDVK